MQVYKEPQIITNKPSKKELKTIKHHIVAAISVSKNFDVAQFVKLAKASIKIIFKKEKPPIFVVGTGFYLSSLLDGISLAPKADLKFRKRLYKIAGTKGNVFLHNRLKRIDRKASERIHPNDLKKVIRALEIYQESKIPISKLERQSGIYNDYEIEIIGIDLARSELYNRINKRTLLMFRKGLIREVKRLLKGKLSQTASQIIGIKQIKGYLEGHYSLDEAKRLLARDTRRYAKRQLTWFRRDKRIRWLQEKEIIKYAFDRFNC